MCQHSIFDHHIKNLFVFLWTKMANIKEANDCYSRAEKALKTGLMKWTPDYEIAANEYSNAAKIFRQVRIPEKAIEANLKAANCYEKSRSYFSAAKCYEQAGAISKEMKEWDKMIGYYEKCCMYYREHGVPDTAALTFNKIAGVLETIKPEKSAEWYGRCYDITMNEDRYLQAAEYANKAVRMYLKLKNYDEAIRLSDKAFEAYITGGEERSAGRQTVTTVIIQLARDDSVAAQKAYMANKTYIHQDERYTLDQLFQGFDQFDNTTINQALKSPFLSSMDNEIVKIVRDLLLKYQPKTDTGDQYNPSNANNDDDYDDEAGAVL
nr:gamma-soluble NSF attachment protein-like [Dermatophagoides farinae]